MSAGDVGMTLTLDVAGTSVLVEADRRGGGADDRAGRTSRGTQRIVSDELEQATEGTQGYSGQEHNGSLDRGSTGRIS